MFRKVNLIYWAFSKAPDINYQHIRPTYNALRYYSRAFKSQAQPVLEYEEKVIKVSLIGVPNSGKSTLINSLMNRKVCPVSCKAHTTKSKAKALCNVDNTQIVFLDTPGIITPREKKKFKLGDSMMSDLKNCLGECDIIGVLQDVGSPWSRDFIHSGILDLLKQHDKVPHFLVLNKIDLMKSKRKLLDYARILTNNTVSGKPISKYKIKEEKGHSGFSDIFMMSALECDGIDALKDYLIRNAKPGKWLFPENQWTDQDPETLILQSIRAKFLDFLPQEIPYKLTIEIEYYENNDDRLNCMVAVVCPTNRILNLVAGKDDSRLQRISDSVRFDLMNMFKKTINLTISLVLPEDPKEVDSKKTTKK